ncbi:hypothetical protein PCANC_25908 [Puccinia coronata f. sp. avenae]|uniref:Uncharacterized protein n=1 Tax=Puccinia coronata f. sp. avenae TaxID=200324 RepID=A0A2N5S472_9BASI|nr:hypothetical protein PCANC_25908 [Puccinia coronata f. sp. avenae]
MQPPDGPNCDASSCLPSSCSRSSCTAAPLLLVFFATTLVADIAGNPGQSKLKPSTKLEKSGRSCGRTPLKIQSAFAYMDLRSGDAVGGKVIRMGEYDHHIPNIKLPSLAIVPSDLAKLYLAGHLARARDLAKLISLFLTQLPQFSSKISSLTFTKYDHPAVRMTCP